MHVYLVHHADAVGPGEDARRPLSPLGFAQAEWLAAFAQAAGTRPALIWHSGKLRSRQTAEAFLRTCSPFATFKMVRGLQPGDPTMWIENALLLEEQDTLVVGHLPHLPALARALGATDPLPLHGMIALERASAAKFVPRWSAEPPADLPVRTTAGPD
jgi:phosphohistidine phosphatase